MSPSVHVEQQQVGRSLLRQRERLARRFRRRRSLQRGRKRSTWRTSSTFIGLSSAYSTVRQLPGGRAPARRTAPVGARSRSPRPRGGSTTVKQLPTPGSLLDLDARRASARTSRRVMTRPMPVPSMPRRSAPRRLNGSNSCARCCVAQARGRCRARCTCTAARRPRAPARPSTRPPGRLYLIALLTAGSRAPGAGARGRPARAARASAASASCSARRRRARGRRRSAIASATTASSASVSGDSGSAPLSMRDRSSTSLIIASRCAPARSMCCTLSRCARLSGCAASMLQQLREAEHRVQRRAQLMAHARQELGLRGVGALGRCGGDERLLRSACAR